jgi:signal transduction histidine kinase
MDRPPISAAEPAPALAASWQATPLRERLLRSAAPTPELARQGRWLNALLLSFVVIGTLAAPVGLFVPHSGLLQIDGTAVLVFVGLYLLNRRGAVRLAAGGLVITLAIASLAPAAFWEGSLSSKLIEPVLFVLVIITAGTFLPWRTVPLLVVLSSAVAIWYYNFSPIPLLVMDRTADSDGIAALSFIMPVVYGAVGVLSWLSNQVIAEAFAELHRQNADLQARTTELAAANQAKDETLRREQVARQDLAFLAEASRILGGSLDATPALASVCRHIISYLADACSIHVVDEAGQLQPVAAAHVDPGKVRLLGDIERSYPLAAQTPYGFPHITASGESDFYPQVTGAQLAKVAQGSSLALLQALEVHSYMGVPLVARGRKLGAISLLRCHAGQDYTLADLALAQDLGQRIALALDNAHLYRTAQQAVQVRDDFLSVASHELKTPLTSLHLAVQSVLRNTRQDTPPSADYLTRRLTMVDDQTKRLTHLVNDLLDISRISAGRLDLEPQAMDLAALTRRVVAQFHEELAEAGCAVTMQADTPVHGYWDPARLEQVLINLLTNAMKYGRGQPIAVSVEATGPTATLIVRDQGIGIAPEHQERIFERFERAVKPGKYGGMGLGLYIVRQIVEAHRGRIQVSSGPTPGSTFTVTLPIQLD